MPSREALRILQWNAGGLSQLKREELVQSLKTHDIDAFTIMEANLTNDKQKYFSFKGYFLYILPKSRRVASWLELNLGSTADFCK
ncbi:hypothetical protein TNCV_4706781 [Trichonephila clavipes]|nr:hypothetical protein TNCV_4706781 [Trichonephila clavipes]